MAPESFGYSADSEMFTLSVRLDRDFDDALLDTTSSEYTSLKQDIINAVHFLFQ